MREEGPLSDSKAAMRRRTAELEEELAAARRLVCELLDAWPGPRDDGLVWPLERPAPGWVWR